MGGKPMARSGIYQTFTKPFYFGRFEYPAGSGNWYQGKHEPMITEAEYDRVQTLLGRKGNPRPQRHFDFPFTGLIRCGECGLTVTAEEKHQVMCGNCKFKFAYPLAFESWIPARRRHFRKPSETQPDSSGLFEAEQ
jgi:hypothetical protein